MWTQGQAVELRFNYVLELVAREHSIKLKRVRDCGGEKIKKPRAAAGTRYGLRLRGGTPEPNAEAPARSGPRGRARHGPHARTRHRDSQ